MADQEKTSEFVRDFSRVILTLENVLIPEEKLSPTPSVEDGMDKEVEQDLRILGCELIQTAGILLKLPQASIEVAMATGQVIFQRFYYSKSFVKHNMETVAMACINMASKIEERPRRIRDVINVFHHIKQVKHGKTISPLVLDQNYINLKNQVIKAERRVLKELGFCVHVKHPHKIIITYLQVLECEKNQPLAQMACSQQTGQDRIVSLSVEATSLSFGVHLSPVRNYMNDSFRSNVFVRFHPETIACACIYLAGRKLKVPLPNNPPWYALFNVEEADIQDVCVSILELYSRKKPNADQLEKIVNECKKMHIEAKLKAKVLSAGDLASNSSSRQATPNKLSPSSLAAPNVKKIKSDADHSDHSSFGGGSRKKRSRSHTPRSRSRSNSKSRSYSSQESNSSASPQHSPSPAKYSKKEARDNNKYYSKDYENHYDRDYHHRDSRHDHERGSAKHKRRRHTPTYSPVRSYSRSPEPRSKTHKKYYKEKYRARSGSHEYETKHHSSKKRNGHHHTRSGERYRR
ncbi:hypothetical protein LSH36_497g02057 [Paralvinella palmiformis]|uniref:Cyclin-like domain-containing protein n=1 Tax=Paralvinella palmiformis TaxID=53620 RepID=A0AAD9J975_9ANNE|nr:hypothetical protein LSH36_497g02057 [Paralvinella palmiformis]